MVLLTQLIQLNTSQEISSINGNLINESPDFFGSRMRLAMINNSTVTQFIEDEETFESCIGRSFAMLDCDGDGALSREELRAGFGRVLPLGSVSDSRKEVADKLFEEIFERFDSDRNGAIDREQFKSLSKEMMLAMARGIGDLPVQLAVDRDSLLMRAVEHELARL